MTIFLNYIVLFVLVKKCSLKWLKNKGPQQCNLTAYLKNCISNICCIYLIKQGKDIIDKYSRAAPLATGKNNHKSFILGEAANFKVTVVLS